MWVERYTHIESFSWLDNVYDASFLARETSFTWLQCAIPLDGTLSVIIIRDEVIMNLWLLLTEEVASLTSSLSL